MKIKYLLIALLITATAVSAQTSKLSVGLVSTHFHNYDASNRISNADNPLAYGVIVGYNVDKNLSVAFTGEFSNADLQNVQGTETDIRGHLSMYFTPFSLNFARPYVSAGLVYSHRSFDYAASELNDDSDGKIYGRYGVGVDVPLLNNISLNGDLGGYSNGLKAVGWSGSIGFRYGL